MRVYFTNLGCKLNQAELERLSREFVAAGHTVAPSLEAADLHVINSCTVTHVAARTSRKVARRGLRVNPRLKTVLTGCYATAEPKAAARLAGVDLVVANQDKEQLLDMVQARLLDQDAGPQVPVPYVPLAFGNTRALVKVQDGCNMRCAFCIIPFTRGAERSRSVDEIVQEVRALAAGGYMEVVVTGVQISSYRHGDAGLYELTRALLESTAIPRLRLTSTAPWQIDRRLLSLWQDERLCRHVHMSLQSGCTATLRRMRRPYTADMYAEVVALVRGTVPDVAITTDVIVGFPGESDDEFEQSLEFVERMGFARIHVFPYSARDGTEAVTLADQVPYPAQKPRLGAMLRVADDARTRFHRQFLGREVDVLWESQRDGCWQGTTDNYIQAFTHNRDNVRHTVTTVRLTELVDQGVMGQPVATA
jgi:threonylcarbamoyladenosine tRNA methylthiotransferase MtaB